MGRSPSLLRKLYRTSRAMSPLPCPGCGGTSPQLFLRRDRYLLPIDVSGCTLCGLIYAAAGVEGEAEAEFYRSVYSDLMDWPPSKASLERFVRIAEQRWDLVVKHGGIPDSMLEIGAGFGDFLALARKAGVSKFFGLEPGDAQRETARRTHHFGPDELSAEALTSSTQLPFAPQTVVLFHVLEHLSAPKELLRTIASRMEPGGLLVVEVPDLGADWRKLNLWQFHISHRSYFTEATLSNVLRDSGFRLERVEKEADGIYIGNLRIYARQGADKREAAPVDLVADMRHARKLLRPFSRSNGYPRAIIRLLRLSLKRREQPA